MKTTLTCYVFMSLLGAQGLGAYDQQHVLAGIQFALGDLQASTTPSSHVEQRP